MAGRLAAYVNVARGAETFHFGPDDEVPDWAAAKITNPDAWAEAPEVVEEPEPQPEQPPAGPPAPEPPPRGGPGSGVAAWRAYAQALGVPVGTDATRDEVIEAVEAEGHRID